MNGANQAQEKPPEKPPGVAKEAAGAVAKKGVKAGVNRVGKVLVNQGGKLLAKLGVREVVSDITAAIGTALGPAGTAVGKALGYAATFIAEKVVGWVRKHKKEAALAGILGAGLLTGSSLLLAGGFAFGAFLFFSALIFPIIVMAAGVLVGGIVFTFFMVALIVYIINTGAYVVPHAPSLIFVSESPFIKVEKEAEPAGKFKNPPPTITVTYTITVTATLSTLTNISFEHKCTVIREGSIPSCPAPLPAETPSIISPVGEPFVFTYTATYDTKFTDSAVVDTFTVIADTEERAGASASATETVIIGDPPLGCFEFEPAGAPFTSEFQAAAAELASHPTYMAKLCASGPITVQLNTTGGASTAACAGISGANTLFFNNCAFYSRSGFITYLLAHESGHIYNARLGNEGFTAFTEGFLPTYCLRKRPYEDFAETIADFVDNGRLGPLCQSPDQRPFNICGGDWPLHCDFARNVIFNE